MDQLSRPRRLAIAVIAAFGTIACAANAADRTENFKADAIELKDFIGTVEVKVGGRSIDVKLTDGAEHHPVDFSVQNGTLVIAGEKRPKNFRIHRLIDWDRDGENALRIFLEDYPHLLITAPAGADIKFDDAIVIALVDSLKSRAVVDGGYVEAAFGDMKSGDISISGAGNISMGAVADSLEVAIGGSGDFEALSAASASVSIGGSGDVRIGAVSGDVDIAIGGSGDVDFASIGGAIEVAVHGSGEVFAGSVAKGANLSIAGSGDISLDRINGPTSATIAGSGDIGIKDGRAEDLQVMIAGSGDFTFGGVSTNLTASIIGSGGVSIARNEGRLTYSGNGGALIVGGERLKKK